MSRLQNYINAWRSPEVLLEEVQNLLELNLKISEYDLLKELGPLTDHPVEDSNLDLFQRHFLLFHTLYRIQTLYLEADKGYLVIEPMAVELVSSKQSHNTHPSLYLDGPLRDYYLDIANLGKETAQSVDDMLGQFWCKYLAHNETPWALNQLELDSADDISKIKKQYKKLTLRYHPDRGGDKNKLQSLNKAYQILLNAI